jgi:hypothetical protein
MTNKTSFAFVQYITFIISYICYKEINNHFLSVTGYELWTIEGCVDVSDGHLNVHGRHASPVEMFQSATC